jgi:hypothetical protein
MLTVTERAKQELSRLLDRKDLAPDMVVRVIMSPTNSQKLDLVYGKEVSTDLVLRDDAGRKLLVLDTDLARALGETTLDFRSGPGGGSETFCMRPRAGVS